MTNRILLVAAFIVLTFIACDNKPEELKEPVKDSVAVNKADMNQLAEKYVKLALQLGRHDQDYVDAYYGPDSLKEKAENDTLNLEQINTVADYIIEEMNGIDTAQLDAMPKLRWKYLSAQITALKARCQYLSGTKIPFDEESKLLFDVVSPTYQDNYYQKILLKLDSLVPGKGKLRERFVKYRRQFIIPPEKLDTVFQAAISESKSRTLKHVKLQDNEKFVIEYVTDKPWGGYNWYKGNGFSLIQINTDLPVYIDRAIDLACHEGYPGHHVYHQLLDQHMLKERKWIEFSIYPLFSPQALISEGTANYGIEVVFPKEDRMKFEKEVLFPMAGIDVEKADQYYEILDLLAKLSYVSNDAARKYLDGQCKRSEAIKQIMKFKLRTEAHAAKNVDFIEKYRSYIINYNVGYDLVKSYIEKNCGTDDNPEKKWELFVDLLTKPVIPSDLQ